MGLTHILSCIAALSLTISCKARRPSGAAELRNTGAQVQEVGSSTVLIQFLNRANQPEGICSGSLTNAAADPNGGVMILAPAWNQLFCQKKNFAYPILTFAEVFTSG